MISCSLSGGHVKMTNKRLGCPKIKEVDIITCVGNCLSWEDVIQVPRSLLGGRTLALLWDPGGMTVASWTSVTSNN